jgi:hypothetical protein
MGKYFVYSLTSLFIFSGLQPASQILSFDDNDDDDDEGYGGTCTRSLAIVNELQERGIRLPIDRL